MSIIGMCCLRLPATEHINIRYNQLMTEREGQMPFGGLGMELVIDLDTHQQTLRRKTKKSPTGGVKKPAPTRQWWEIMGSTAFNRAAEGWRVSRAASMAEEFGHSVEFAGPQMTGAETEGLLKQVFAVAKRSRITAVGVAEMMRAESLRIEGRLGVGANWLPPFVDTAIDLLAEVYRLNAGTTRGLKDFAHQKALPAFN